MDLGERVDAAWAWMKDERHRPYVSLGFALGSAAFSAYVAQYVTGRGIGALLPSRWDWDGIIDWNPFDERAGQVKGATSFTYRYFLFEYIDKFANSRFINRCAQYADDITGRDVTTFAAGTTMGACFLAYKGFEYKALSSFDVRNADEIMYVSLGLSFFFWLAAAKVLRDPRSIPRQVRDGCARLRGRSALPVEKLPAIKDDFC
jgi:hypothetical protein